MTNTNISLPTSTTPPSSSLDSDRLLAWLPMRPYQHIAEIGYTQRSFALPLAKYLYDGKLYLFNHKDLLAKLKDMLAPYKFTNVEYSALTKNKISTKPNSLDGLLLSFALDVNSDLVPLLHSLSLALRKNAWIVALGSYTTPDGQRKTGFTDSPEFARATQLFMDVGFRVISSRDMGEQQYLLLATAKPSEVES